MAKTRGLTSGRERRQAHIDWLSLIEVSGPFLSVPVIAAEWPDLEPIDTRQGERLRRARVQQSRRCSQHPRIRGFLIHKVPG